MLYTIGYTGLKIEKLKQWAEDHNALIVDIRLSPRSRAPQWNKGKLSAALGDLYHHIPALGNINYKGGPIQLKDPTTGIQQVQQLLTGDTNIILMCVCADVTTCHRTPAAELIATATGQTVQHLTTATVNTTGQPIPPKQLSMFADVPDKATKPRTKKEAPPTMFSDKEFFEPVKKPPMYGDYTGKLGLYKEDPRTAEEKAAALQQQAQENTLPLIYQTILTLIETLPLYKEDPAARVMLRNTQTNETLIIHRFAPDSFYSGISAGGGYALRTLAELKAFIADWQPHIEIIH